MTIAVLVAALLIPTVAWSQACASRADVVKRLSGKFREAPIAIAMMQTGEVVEVWASVEGNTWTIVTTDVHGTSCQVAAGTGWQSIPFHINGERS